MQLKVAVDTYALYVARAGSARYVRGLLRGLREVAPPDLDWFEFGWKTPHFSFRQPFRALRTVYREIIWAKWVAPGILTRQKAGLLHSTAVLYVQPPPGVKHVATLLDLAPLRHPERFRPWHRYTARRRLRDLAGTDKVICISRFTADEAIGLLGLPSRLIEVIYCGNDFEPAASPPAASAQSFEHLKVPGEFFLFVGSLEPGKNLSLLREVYRLAEREAVSLPPLVILGARWSGVSGEGRPPANWHYLGWQSDEVLLALYRRALALVFPSKYEGFGFPVLEAMSQRCPVLCSPVASLPEIGGDAALFSELDPRSYLVALKRLLDDSTLRERLKLAGQNQAMKFSWQQCARETIAVYRGLKRS